MAIEYRKNHQFVEAIVAGNVVGRFDFSLGSFVSLKTGNCIKTHPVGFRNSDQTDIVFFASTNGDVWETIYTVVREYLHLLSPISLNNIERLFSLGINFSIQEMLTAVTPLKLTKDILQASVLDNIFSLELYFTATNDIIASTSPAVRSFILKTFSNEWLNMNEDMRTFLVKQLVICEHEKCLDESRSRLFNAHDLHDLLTRYCHHCMEMYGEMRVTRNFLTQAIIVDSLYIEWKNNNIRSAIEQNNTADFLKYENEHLIVTFLSSPELFHKEAEYQHNCVERIYMERVAEGQTFVVAIRKKEDIDTPYITCEVGKNGKIVQYLTRFNDRVTDKIGVDFYKEYQEHLEKCR